MKSDIMVTCLTVVSAFLIGGCASNVGEQRKDVPIAVAEPPQPREQTFAEACPIGSGKKCVLSFLGAPKKISKISGEEIWHYVFNDLRDCQLFFNKKGKTEKSKCFETAESEEREERRREAYFERTQHRDLMAERAQDRMRETDAAQYRALKCLAGAGSSNPNPDCR